MNSSLGDLDATEKYYEYDNISASNEYDGWITSFILGWIALTGISLIICCIGFVGNGYIIWLLGFQIKRNCFTTFILNLAIAVFGFLASAFIYNIDQFLFFLSSEIPFLFCVFFLYMMYINANFLLTAISIDRCVAVLFPIWHRCSRPKHLSSPLCVLLWISSFLLSGIMIVMKGLAKYRLPSHHFLVSAIVCLPLITLSTVVLFIKVCVKPKQKNNGRLLLMILITLLCFLTLAFPLNAFVVFLNFLIIQSGLDLQFWQAGIIMCSCLNSSINPVIYFLVGRKKGTRSKESMKVILQKIFKEGEPAGGR